MYQRDELSSGDEDTKKKINKRSNRQKLFDSTNTHQVLPLEMQLNPMNQKSCVIEKEEYVPKLFDAKEFIYHHKHTDPDKEICNIALYKSKKLTHHDADPILLGPFSPQTESGSDDDEKQSDKPIRNTKRRLKEVKEEVKGEKQRNQVVSSAWDQVKIARHHQKVAQYNPYQCKLFQEKKSELVIPNFYLELDYSAGLSQEKLNQMLCGGLEDLPLLTADFETLLLAEGGRHRDKKGVVRDFPVCVRNERCCGRTVTIEGMKRKVSFTALMLPNEYQHFLDTNSVSAEIKKRTCILCYRYFPVDYALYCRDLYRQTQSEKPDENATEPWTIQPMQVVQTYYNKMDCEGGYFSQFCFQPMRSTVVSNEPIIQPICRFSRTELRCYEVNNRVYIDQSALIYKVQPCPQPAIGESVTDF